MKGSIWGKAILLICAGLLMAAPVMAQDESVISGFVYDDETGDPLPGANVFLVSRADTTVQVGGVTNEKGLYRLTVPAAGSYAASFSFVGFETHYKPIEATGSFTFGSMLRLT